MEPRSLGFGVFLLELLQAVVDQVLFFRDEQNRVLLRIGLQLVVRLFQLGFQPHQLPLQPVGSLDGFVPLHLQVRVNIILGQPIGHLRRNPRVVRTETDFHQITSAHGGNLYGVQEMLHRIREGLGVDIGWRVVCG